MNEFNDNNMLTVDSEVDQFSVLENATGFSSDDAVKEDYFQFLLHYAQEAESHRTQLISEIDSLRSSEEEILGLRWSLRKKEDELIQLQATSARNKHLFLSARQDLEHLSEQNDQLRQRELSDRKRIAQLLAMTRPVGEDITFLVDSANEVILPKPHLRVKLLARRTAEEKTAKRASPSTATFGDSASTSTENGQSAVRETGEIDMLKALLAKSEQEHQQDLRIHAEERECSLAYFKEKSDNDTKLIEQLRGALFLNTKELCQCRHSAQIKLRKFHHKMVQIKNDAERDVGIAMKNATDVMERYEELLADVKAEHKETISVLRTSDQLKGNAIHDLSSRLTETQEICATEMKKMCQKTTSLHRRCELLSKFRYYCLRGYESELHLLTKHIEALERKIFYSLKPGLFQNTTAATTLKEFLEKTKQHSSCFDNSDLVRMATGDCVHKKETAAKTDEYDENLFDHLENLRAMVTPNAFLKRAFSNRLSPSVSSPTSRDHDGGNVQQKKKRNSAFGPNCDVNQMTLHSCSDANNVRLKKKNIKSNNDFGKSNSVVASQLPKQQKQQQSQYSTTTTEIVRL